MTQRSTTTSLLPAAKARLEREGDLDHALQFLRENGCNFGESIKVTMALTGVSLGEAKETVFNSEAWHDQRADLDALHQSIDDRLEYLEDETTTVTRDEHDRRSNA